jgi:hypothetical protein
VANPDGDLEALMVYGSVKNRTLMYYYCTAELHGILDLDDEGRCHHVEGSSEHNPAYYRAIWISNGKLNKKTNITTFPAGSSWHINDKVNRATIAEGILANDVTCTEVYAD